MQRTRITPAMLAGLILVAGLARLGAVEVSTAEWEQMKARIAELEKTKAPAAPMRTAVDRTMDKYGPNQTVSTAVGKLQMGALMQCWYYAFQRDDRGLFDNPGAGVSDVNSAQDINGFRIRRMELMFKMDINENVTANVKIDPAKEANAFPSINDNQTNAGPGMKIINNVGPEYQSIVGSQKPLGFGKTSSVANVQTGGGSANAMLENAYINYHGIVPHHDFFIGQYQPKTDESAVRDNGQLDFVERSFLGLIDGRYAPGAGFHGSWWDDGRLQYWGTISQDPGNFWQTSGSSANRPDDKQEKDFGARVLVRPVWKDCTWGDLEIGGGTLAGEHGNSGNSTPITNPDNGVDRTKVFAYDHFAWLYYAPGASAKGLWVRGEWKLIQDRMAPGTVVDLNGDGNNPKSIYVQENGAPLRTGGFYAALGYKFSESAFCDSIPSCLKPIEFCGRYQQFQNVVVANPIDPYQSRAFMTKVITGGINYYIRGHACKVQANYNWVINPDVNDGGITFHNVKDDSFALNFQVEW